MGFGEDLGETTTRSIESLILSFRNMHAGACPTPSSHTNICHHGDERSRNNDSKPPKQQQGMRYLTAKRNRWCIV